MVAVRPVVVVMVPLLLVTVAKLVTAAELVTIKVLVTVVGPVTTAELVTVVLLQTSSAAVLRQMEFAVGVAVPAVVLFPTVVVALLGIFSLFCGHLLSRIHTEKL